MMIMGMFIGTKASIFFHDVVGKVPKSQVGDKNGNHGDDHYPGDHQHFQTASSVLGTGHLHNIQHANTKSNEA